MNRHNNKKIGLDLRMLGSSFGIGRYSAELSKKIIETDPDNSYFLFVRKSAAAREFGIPIRENVKVVVADYRHYSIEEQVYFPLLLKSYKLDLVHFFNFNVPYFYNLPFVVTVHDMIHHKLPGNKKKRFLHRLAYRMIIKHAVTKSHSIITVSNASKKDILNFYAVDPAKISVIYEAASIIAVSDSDIAAARQKFGISKKYLIFVGVLERKKNLQALGRAFDILKDQYNLNIQLVLAGKADPNYPEIVEELRSARYSKDLILTGEVTDKEKYALYKGAVAFVSASVYEGFGLPGVEAMSIGLPLIVSNTEVFNEIYDNGAVYFDPKNPDDIARQINFIFGDDKYRELIAANAFQRSKLFSWQQAARQTTEVYNL